MRLFKPVALFTLIVLLAAAVATPTEASIVYDTSLYSPPGVFFGSGNPNTDWTVDDEAGGVQLGLLGLERYIGAYVPDAGTSVYHAATGATTKVGKTGSAWGIAFSINTGANAIASYTTSWCLTDVALGATGCFDPLNSSAITDNAFSGNVAQNSEALSYINIATAFSDANYDMYADDTYVFTLTLLDSNSVAVGSVSATIVTGSGAGPATPEPTTLALFGLGFLGVALARRFASGQST